MEDECVDCKKVARLEECLKWALEYIDAIPSGVADQFPTMPGFDRDYVDMVLMDALPNDDGKG